LVPHHASHHDAGGGLRRDDEHPLPALGVGRESSRVGRAACNRRDVHGPNPALDSLLRRAGLGGHGRLLELPRADRCAIALCPATLALWQKAKETASDSVSGVINKQTPALSPKAPGFLCLASPVYVCRSWRRICRAFCFACRVCRSLRRCCSFIFRIATRNW